MATTQTVTVLFTDLVGSTELSSRLGPQATDALRLTHFGLLRNAIQTAGGTEVKNLGDGLMVAFTSLSRALACAVGMQQAIDRHNHRGEGAELSVRIGISAGEATEEAGDYFGDPVVEAARLCAKADGGQILATEVVKFMAGRHATQEFISVGDLELKGLPEPVATVEVVWEPAQASEGEGGQFPMPARLVGASAESLFAFFGRAGELTRLTDAQKTSAAEHHLRVTLISGEPGIGKTTLVAQAARSAHSAGANVVYGSCEEGLGIPYQPWTTALSQLIDQADEAVLRELVDTKGLALAHLLPDLARRLSLPVPTAGSDADTERFLILEGVARLLALASTSAPLVVVLDDLHWVDAASLQLLRHLVTSAIPMSALVVGTYRESDLSRSHPLVGALADLRRESCVDRLDLLGLEEIEIIDLLGAAAGHDVADQGVGLAHALRRETGGNPFFLVEVIRHLAATGAFVQDAAGRWVLSTDLDDLGLPSSVREVVAHRVARLGEATEQALSLAAVIGREFDLEVLAALLDTDEGQLLDLLEGATVAGLITESEHRVGRYRFLHALIQHTLYQDLSTARRQLAHRKVAEALEAAGADDGERVAELARHWIAATRPSDATKAVYYARRAGDAALAAYAPLDAVSWYTQALELHSRQAIGDDREHGALLVGLGTARLRAGLPEHRDTLREAGRIALRLTDRNLLVSVALSRDPGAETMSEADQDRLAVLHAALDAVGPADSPERARLLAGLAEEIDPRDVNERTAIAGQAIDVAHRLGDDATFMAVWSLAVIPITTPDTVERRRRESKLALELSQRMGDVSVRFEALQGGLQSAMESADLNEVDACLAEMEEIAGRTGLLYQSWNVCIKRSWRHLLAGRLAEAEANANAGLEIGTKIGLGIATGTYGAQIVDIYTQQGRLAELVDVAVQAGEENPTLPSWRTALLFLYTELGRYNEAAVLFDTELATSFRELPFDMTWLQSMAYYADCAADLGRTDAAPLLYERLSLYAGLVIFVGALDKGAVARSLGRLATMLGRYDEAETHLRRALEMHEHLEAPYWIARTQLDLAELCVARQGPADAENAHELIETARRTTEQHGYAGLLPRVDRLLAGL